MRTTTRVKSRDQGKRNHIPDGVGGTITGGPMPKLDLIEILNRSARSASGAGAVSGAAQVVVSSPETRLGMARGIALSDGSLISFASVEEEGVLKYDDARCAAGV